MELCNVKAACCRALLLFALRCAACCWHALPCFLAAPLPGSTCLAGDSRSFMRAWESLSTPHDIARRFQPSRCPGAARPGHAPHMHRIIHQEMTEAVEEQCPLLKLLAPYEDRNPLNPLLDESISIECEDSRSSKPWPLERFLAFLEDCISQNNASWLGSHALSKKHTLIH